jgi:hypothetical protein
MIFVVDASSAALDGKGLAVGDGQLVLGEGA